MMKILITALMIGGIAFFSPAALAESPHFDREYIVDVSSLREEISAAFGPLQTKVRETKLAEKFEEVFLLLEREETCNEKLRKTLQDLKEGIYSFRLGWDKIVNPLWAGQARIGEIISQVRSLLASSQEPGKEAEEEEAPPYEERLRKIAREIRDEPCPQRRERLTLMFRNIYNLRRIGRGVRVNLTPARQLLLSRVLEALRVLDLQLTQVTFSAEEAFAILGQQQDFLDDYIGILTGLIEIDELTAWLVGDGEGLATVEGLVGDFQKLGESITSFQNVMDLHTERLIVGIEEKSARLELHLPRPVFEDDLELERLIYKYSK